MDPEFSHRFNPFNYIEPLFGYLGLLIVVIYSNQVNLAGTDLKK